MSEEEGQPVQAQDQVPSTTETPPVPAFDWKAELDKVPADELRKHPRFAGTLGFELQKGIEAHEARKAQEGTQQRRSETEEELMKFFEDNADYVQQHYPKAYDRFTEMQQEKAQREVSGLQGKAITAVGLAIGHALADVPEWSMVTDEDKRRLAEKLVGKSDNEALAIFNREAWSLVAEIRANQRHEDWKQRSLTTEREAIRQEEAAKLFKGKDGPDLARSKGQPARVNVNSMTDEEFTKYWNNSIKK